MRVVLLLSLLLLALEIHGSDPPSNSSASSAAPDRDSMTCDEIHRMDHPSNTTTVFTISLLPPNLEPDSDEIGTERKKLIVKTIIKTYIGALGAVPLIGGGFGALNPIVDFSFSPVDQSLKLIQRGFDQLSRQIYDGLDSIEKLIQFQPLRQIQDQAAILVALDNDVTSLNETDYARRNITTLTFLKECEDHRPYSMILEVGAQVERLFESQWRTDVLKSFTALQKLNQTVHGILQELLLVRGNELLIKFNDINGLESVYNMKLAKAKMENIANTVAVFMEKKLETNDYWSDVHNIAVKVLEGQDKSNMQEKSKLLLSSLQDIHTRDKFCVAILSGGVRKMREENMYGDSISGFGIYIYRSKGAHNMTQKEFMKKGKAIEEIREKCETNGDSPRGRPESNLDNMAKEHGFQYIPMHDAFKKSQAQACDCFMRTEFVASCTWNTASIEYVEKIRFHYIPY